VILKKVCRREAPRDAEIRSRRASISLMEREMDVTNKGNPTTAAETTAPNQ
jgi:hypothetical protein